MQNRYFLFSYILFEFLISLEAANPGWEDVHIFNKTTVAPLYHYGEKSYYVGDNFKASFFQAEQFCRDIGMNLVSIITKEEWEAVQELIKGKGNNFWTSGSTLLDRSHWVWLGAGKLVGFAPWGPGQPSNPSEEKCIEIYRPEGTAFLLNDRNCDSQVQFICDRYISKTKEEMRKSLQTEWGALLGNRDYYISNNMMVDFWTANQVCKMLGMQLLSFPSKEAENKLTTLIDAYNAGTSFWTSGTKLVTGNAWTWLSTGKNFEYSNWLLGQPDSIDEQCVELKKAPYWGWNNFKCNERLPFICEKAIERPEGGLPTTTLNGKTYYVSDEKQLKASDAAKFCQWHGMQLVIISDKCKNEEVKTLIRSLKRQSYWTAGQKQNNYWLWGEKKHIEYFNWKQNEPNNYGNIEGCIEIDINGEWNDLQCSANRNFICESTNLPTEYCQAKCQTPVIHVHVNNHVLTEGKTFKEPEKLISSDKDTCSKSDFNVLVNTNIDASAKAITPPPPPPPPPPPTTTTTTTEKPLFQIGIGK